MTDLELDEEVGQPQPTQGDAPSGVRHIIAVGGGRGGVGKSLLTVNLGVYLAQLGRTVLVADADLAGSGLHTQLGLDRPPLADPDEVENMVAQPVATLVPGLALLPSAYDPVASSPFRPGRKARWLAKLRHLPADYILLHLGAGTSPATLDLFLAADVGICVTAPDPAAIESTYRFLRSLYLRQLRRWLMRDRFKLRMAERVLKELGPLPSPIDVISAIACHDTSLAEAAEQQLHRIVPRFVVNQTRVRTDLELGVRMQQMVERYLGLFFEYIGHIEQDDQAWLTARRRRPLLVDSPTAKSARNLERIARRVVVLAGTLGQRVPDVPVTSRERRANLYDVLGVSRGASDEDVRRAYKRQRELYTQESLPLTSLVDETELRSEISRIQEAYDTILDPVRRRAYNLSQFPETEEQQNSSQTPARSPNGDLLLLQAEIAREVHPETEFTGDLLRRVRESQCVEIGEIAMRTKISTAHLSALEAERYDELPAEVYVRGFVQQLARQLKLDPTQVVKTYMWRMRSRLAQRGQS